MLTLSLLPVQECLRPPFADWLCCCLDRSDPLCIFSSLHSQDYLQTIFFQHTQNSHCFCLFALRFLEFTYSIFALVEVVVHVILFYLCTSAHSSFSQGENVKWFGCGHRVMNWVIFHSIHTVACSKVVLDVFYVSVVSRFNFTFC